MKEKRISAKVSARRHEKLKRYAQQKEKTITQVLEEWIDKLRLEKDTRG